MSKTFELNHAVKGVEGGADGYLHLLIMITSVHEAGKVLLERVYIIVNRGLVQFQ